MPTVNPVPDGYPRVIPYLTVDRASDAIAFYARVFGARERVRMPTPDGKVGHAELAIGAGATLDRPVENQFYGDRAGQFVDPFGHRWFVATHVEDVAPEEMEKRMRVAMGA